VATAGDLTQMQVQVEMVGTLLGVAPPSVPMPRSLTLANDGFLCGQPSGQGSFFLFFFFGRGKKTSEC